MKTINLVMPKPTSKSGFGVGATLTMLGVPNTISPEEIVDILNHLVEAKQIAFNYEEIIPERKVMYLLIEFWRDNYNIVWHCDDYN